jgi:hypothetical protein
MLPDVLMCKDIHLWRIAEADRFIIDLGEPSFLAENIREFLQARRRYPDYLVVNKKQCKKLLFDRVWYNHFKLYQTYEVGCVGDLYTVNVSIVLKVRNDLFLPLEERFVVDSYLC